MSKNENGNLGICEMLGVGIDEVWMVSGMGRNLYRVNTSGHIEEKVEYEIFSEEVPAQLVADLINGAKKVIPAPRWTEEDAADAAAIRRLWPGATRVCRNNLSFCLNVFSPANGWMTTIESKAIPSLRCGDAADLDGILSGECEDYDD